MITADEFETNLNTKMTILTQRMISYFNDILLKIDKMVKDEEGKPSTLTSLEISRLAKDIEEYLMRRIDILKQDKKYQEPLLLEYLKFSLIALIDELLLVKNWPGKTLWQNESLEKKIFGTRAGGDIFFENCKKILSDRDYKYRELSLCYYFCLCSGFRGKYHSEYEEKYLEQIKSDLLTFYTENISEFKTSSSCFLPNESIKNKKFSQESKLRKTFFLLIFLNILAFIFFVIISLLIWSNNKTTINKFVQQVSQV